MLQKMTNRLNKLIYNFNNINIPIQYGNNILYVNDRISFIALWSAGYMKYYRTNNDLLNFSKQLFSPTELTLLRYTGKSDVIRTKKS